jgi:hypothetical protein
MKFTGMTVTGYENSNCTELLPYYFNTAVAAVTTIHSKGVYGASLVNFGCILCNDDLRLYIIQSHVLKHCTSLAAFFLELVLFQTVCMKWNFNNSYTAVLNLHKRNHTVRRGMHPNRSDTGIEKLRKLHFHA